MTHPHPLYGGDMHNHVVEAIVQAYRENNYTTLRFNFRGIGRSEGNHDNGGGERTDVRAAIEYLFGLGKTHLALAGYSFGAWVNALELENLKQVEHMIMVSPPVNFMDFGQLSYCPRIRLVITGAMDEFAQVDTIEKLLPVWNPDAVFHVISGSDHFYMNEMTELKSIVNNLLNIT